MAASARAAERRQQLLRAAPGACILRIARRQRLRRAVLCDFFPQ